MIEIIASHGKIDMVERLCLGYKSIFISDYYKNEGWIWAYLKDNTMQILIMDYITEKGFDVDKIFIVTNHDALVLWGLKTKIYGLFDELEEKIVLLHR